MDISRCIGQSENLAAALDQRREGNVKKNAHNDTKLKEGGLLLMNRVRANGHLVTLLEGLPLTAKGKTKQQNELAMKVPCTLLFSFQCCFDCIKTPMTAISSLLLDKDLDAEGKDIVRAMLKLRSEWVASAEAKAKGRK